MVEDRPPDPTAGTYIRKRREASGLTIDQVGRAMGSGIRSADFWIEKLRAFEADKDVAGEVTLGKMRAVFNFDMAVYQALAEGCPPGTQLCRVCACSWHDACPGRCSWAEVDLCSSCAGDVLVSAEEPTFVLRGSDPFAPVALTILANLHLGRADEAARILNANMALLLPRLAHAEIELAEAATDAAILMTVWRARQPTASIGEPVHV